MSSFNMCRSCRNTAFGGLERETIVLLPASQFGAIVYSLFSFAVLSLGKVTGCSSPYCILFNLQLTSACSIRQSTQSRKFPPGGIDSTYFQQFILLFFGIFVSLGSCMKLKKGGMGLINGYAGTMPIKHQNLVYCDQA
jgi:hypothetical protein